jgi:membrane protease subunit (stomatin/prohibitin family)
MSLWSWLGRQAIDIIEWVDQARDTLVWRFPRQDNEIKNGAKLIVREGQVAIFVHEGQIGDVFKPGLYSLTTQNLPILTSLRSWKYGFESPFKCEVYFVSTLQHIDMKWGTLEPIVVRDPEFPAEEPPAGDQDPDRRACLVRVRAHGIYAIQVDADRAQVFFRQLVGTHGHIDRHEIERQLRGMLLSSFTNVLGKAKISVVDIPAQLDTLAEQCRQQMEPEFASYGLKLPRFIIESVSLPTEVSKAIDERSSMAAVGDLSDYARFQAARAMADAARQPGSTAGSAMGLGAGAALGIKMAEQSMAAFALPGFAQPPNVPAATPERQQRRSVAERLRELRALHTEGLIDDETLAKKRDEILDDV